MANAPRADIEIPVFEIEKLSWKTPEDAQQSIVKCYQYAELNAQESIAWYGRNKYWKSRMSRLLRVIAIVFTTLGGLAPVLSNMNFSTAADTDRTTYFYIGQIGYLFLGLAAACIAFDKFFGFSSGWMRYISTKLALEKILLEFRLDWAMTVAKFGGNNATPDQVQQMIQQLKEFLIKINSEVERETLTWVDEFRTSLSEIEKNAKASAQASQPGAIDITITNGMTAETGISVYMDGMMVNNKVLGTRYQIGYVPPGTHKVVVEGDIANQRCTASELVTVTSGEIARVTLAFPVQDAQS